MKAGLDFGKFCKKIFANLLWHNHEYPTDFAFGGKFCKLDCFESYNAQRSNKYKIFL